MTDLTPTIEANSDQMNAEDLIAGPKTIRITKVSGNSNKDQPINVFYEGDNNKPFRPCKSMRRVMVHVWGAEGEKYVGRSMTLFRDPEVTWGGMMVGGIRISHMSDLDQPRSMILTASSKSRKPYKVRPLAAQDPSGATSDADLLELLVAEADEGMDALEKAWNDLTAMQRKAMKGHLDDLKVRANNPPVEQEPEIVPPIDDEDDGDVFS
jgi:hypothetical protein